MQLQYQFTERYEKVKTIEFENSNPLHIVRIRFFKEDGLSGTFAKKEFRYSWDRITWTNWNTLTQGNLASIDFKDRPNFYLQLKYTRDGIDTGNIKRWYLFYDGIKPTPPAPPRPIIDADLFWGMDPFYYLDRTNHFGPYPDIRMLNIPDGDDPGVFSHRVDTSSGTDFFFRRIRGRGGISVFEDNYGKIVIDGSSFTGDIVYDNPQPVLKTVGGISQGDTFFDGGKDFAQTMAAIFYPALDPNLIGPSSTFTLSPIGSLGEIGEILDLQFTSVFSRGVIDPSYGTSGFRSGLPESYNYTGFGLPPSVISNVLTDNQEVIGYPIAIGSQTWSSSVSYEGGEQPKNSEGGDFDLPLPAGTTNTISRSIEGVYPIFATTSNISNPNTKQTLMSMLSGNNIVIDLVSETGGFRQSFDIPDAWTGAPTNRPLIGIETFNTVSNQWEYDGGSAGSSLAVWETSPETHTIQDNSVEYTRYTYNSDEKGDRQIRLKF